VNGQTTINPCCFCGEPSVEEIVLYPAQFEKDKKGKLILKKGEVKGWVCPAHKQSVEAGDGWQERQRAQKAARSKRLKQDQLSLGDAA
jgi:hypothetical protein